MSDWRLPQSLWERTVMTWSVFTAVPEQGIAQSILLKKPLWKAVAFVVGLGLSTFSYSALAAPSSGGDIVQGLYDALVKTMKNGRILGQSGRFTQLEPVIQHSFDIASMTRLAVGPSWTNLTEAQRQIGRAHV